MEKRENGLSWIFMICQARHKKLFSRLFHAWLDCFTISHLGAASCLCAYYGAMDESIFLNKIFGIVSLWHQGTIWNILGMKHLIPWIQGSFFSISWVCVCYQHYWITDGWIFMKISGYRHKKELPRPFHAWIDCFELPELGGEEVGALGVLLVCIWGLE